MTENGEINYPLAYVTWVDSAGADGWCFTRDTSNRSLCIHSVGFIIAEDEESLTITGHLGVGGGPSIPEQCSGAITIPQVAIVDRNEFVELEAEDDD